jgi:hypothetical protein
VIEDALRELGVKRLLLAIHDISFPSDPDEDIGRGAPTTRAAARLLAYARSLGFTGIQLGPQGQTEPGNPSPYDSTIFARHLATIAIASFRAGGPYAGLVEPSVLDALITSGPTNHRHADAASRRLVAAIADESVQDPARARRSERWMRGDWRDRMHAFLGNRQHVPWLWRTVASDAPSDARALFGLGQFLAHEEHARLRSIASELGLKLYGDLQVGYAREDAVAHARAFLRDFRMGAPPSRTNPDGQAWGYPVLDPDRFGRDGEARTLFEARIDKALSEYDAIRIDHPHGLVCPWVYRADAADPHVAVREGARLFESPDLPELAAYAIARADQIDHTKPRYHDEWVTSLDDDQVTRYARLFEIIAQAAARHGREMADQSCEVLSTMPYPLRRVLERYGLGRWRVLQKADLGNPNDVYRVEQVKPHDWVMLGNHDTQPIFAVIRSWSAAQRDAWVRHVATHLHIAPDARFARDGYLATAMLAMLFASPAENVSIFWADLFGETGRFNAPGTVSDANWCLRLPADFERLHSERLGQDAALDLPLAVSLALDSRRASKA